MLPCDLAQACAHLVFQSRDIARRWPPPQNTFFVVHRGAGLYPVLSAGSDVASHFVMVGHKTKGPGYQIYDADLKRASRVRRQLAGLCTDGRLCLWQARLSCLRSPAPLPYVFIHLQHLVLPSFPVCCQESIYFGWDSIPRYHYPTVTPLAFNATTMVLHVQDYGRSKGGVGVCSGGSSRHG